MLEAIRRRHFPTPSQHVAWWDWYHPTKLAAVTDGVLRVEVPNKYFQDKLRLDTAAILEAARAEIPEARGLLFYYPSFIREGELSDQWNQAD